MKRVIAIVLCSALLALTSVGMVWADSKTGASDIDVLLKKLVEKKVLTTEEAEAVKKETTAEVKKSVKEGKHAWLPKWVGKTTIKGDMRLRYQGQWQDDKSPEDRNRGRIRFRLGIESEVTDNVKVGARLASGASDPRSTNQTLENFFDTPDIRLDMAWAEFKLVDGLTLVGGKFKNYVWEPGDLMWDGDINPEGAMAVINFDPFFANVGFWILDEYSNSSKDPFMVPIQAGVKYKFGEFDFKVAGTYYYFGDSKNLVPEYSAGTNTRNPDSDTLKYEFDSLAGSAEIGFGGLGFVQRIALFGTYVHNFDPDDNNNGWMVGLKFGDKKLEKLGDWEFVYNYRNLEKDAWLDTFPDSDFYDGKTGVKGHEAILNFGLTKNVVFGIDYYHAEQIGGDVDQDVIQLDIVTKF